MKEMTLYVLFNESYSQSRSNGELSSYWHALLNNGTKEEDIRKSKESKNNAANENTY